MGDVLAIDAVGLRKAYDGVEALRGLDLQVPAGSIFGFLGRNGAGKTTAIKLLLGMARPTGGHARVLGRPIDDEAQSVEIRRRVGFVGEDKGLYDGMSVADMIFFTSRFYPTWRKNLEERYLQRFELPAHRQVKSLSKGMRTKLALLLALARGAELLILDEPTSGLDPAVTEDVLQALVAHVASDGATVFFSSHQIAEVEQIADRVAIVDRGRTVVTGTLDDFREGYRRIRVVFDDDAPAVSFRSPGVERIQRSGRVMTVLASRGADAIVAEARTLGSRSVDATSVSLKDIFLDAVTTEGH